MSSSESPFVISTDSKDFIQKLSSNLRSIQGLNGNKLKLILHVGTPKTGTTSLQTYLDKKHRKLNKLGILYPNQRHNNDAPKHQWFEKNLVRTHPKNLLDNFKSILNEVEENTHTILLSSEGIYNHWWDFPEESKAILKELSNLFEVNIWVWFREPLAFAESFYKQCMRNPVVESIPCYGKDLSFAEILSDPWFNKHLDYIDFVNECDSLFGKSAISVFEYQQDTVQIVSQILGLATPHDNPTPRKNESMNSVSSELYRVINRLGLSAKEKEKLVPHLQELNTALIPYSDRLKIRLIDDKSKAKIKTITEESMRELKKRYINI